MTTLWLDPIPENLRAEAGQRFADGDVLRFLGLASNTASLSLVDINQLALLDRGIYEPALLYALTMSRVNNAQWSMRELDELLGIADLGRLRAAGDPLPGPGPFTVFRGVAGRGRARRVRGLSWTLSLPLAAWFANRWAPLVDPAVYRVTVDPAQVLAYCHESGRREEEVLLMLPDRIKPQRYLDDGPKLLALAEAHEEKKHRERQEMLARLRVPSL